MEITTTGAANGKHFTLVCAVAAEIGQIVSCEASILFVSGSPAMGVSNGDLVGPYVGVLLGAGQGVPLKTDARAGDSHCCQIGRDRRRCCKRHSPIISKPPNDLMHLFGTSLNLLFCLANCPDISLTDM